MSALAPDRRRPLLATIILSASPVLASFAAQKRPGENEKRPLAGTFVKSKDWKLLRLRGK